MATQIVVRGQHVAPSAYKITGLNPFTPSVATAQWDGSGASGDFFPCMSFYSQDGQLLARMGVEAAVTAGDSAQVTYGPFLRQAGGGDGIKYDVDNVGDWLNVETTGAEPGHQWGMRFAVGIGKNTAAGDLDITTGRDWNVDNVGRDFNLQMNRDFNIDPGNDFNLVTVNDNNLSTGRDNNIFAVRDANMNGQNSANVSGGSVELLSRAGGMILWLFTAATTLTVMDHNLNPIFRVDENGALHGKTGQTLTFDL